MFCREKTLKSLDVNNKRYYNKKSTPQGSNNNLKTNNKRN